jgi:predicted PurR-regulated permease PerM
VFGLWGLALALPLMAIVKVIMTYLREDKEVRDPEFRMA